MRLIYKVGFLISILLILQCIEDFQKTNIGIYIKNIMNNKNIIIFFAALLLFFSCANNEKSVSNLDPEHVENAMLQARNLFKIPDSLRSNDEKEIFKKLEAIFWEGSIIKENRIDFTITKEEWKNRGIPEIYYEMLIQDLIDINKGFDTTFNPYAHLMHESVLEAREEYFARKQIQLE